jgi:hypothetical protein
MLQTLVSHNDDIRRLVEKGYAVAFDNTNHLVVRDIPHLDSEGKLKIGAFVTKLEFIDQQRVTQQDHQVFFAGCIPYGLDGQPVPNLAGGTCTVALSKASEDVVVQRSFSNKPRKTGKYKDFFEKIESYANQICEPAREKHGAKWLTFNIRKDEIPSDSVFKIHDTLSSLSEIGDLSAKLKNDVIAIIGLGGTGSYVLDFIAKTPVREIRAFDFDSFHVHNAFRSPGRLDPEAEFGKPKVDIYLSRYDSFRKGLTITQRYVDSSCGAEFEGVTFAFVCVDKGESRGGIFDLLLQKQIPFIDVGIGLKRKDGPLKGTVRITYYSAEHGPKVRDNGYAELVTAPDDLYRTNIQTAEINALNAALAVTRFKQLRGFYLEERPYHHAVFYSHDLKTIGEWENP